MLGSKAILYLLENHFTPTIFLFCGLVLGVVPTIQKKITKNIKHYFTCLITMLICILLFHLKKDSIFEYSNDFLSNLQVSFIGFLEAFTMIVPGISGTALFMNLGYYHFLMQFFSNIMVIVFSSFQVVVLFGFSFLASIYLVSSMMNYLLLHKENITYSVILGFSYISIYFLLKDAIVSIHSLKDIFIGIVLLILGCVLSIKLE
jgi:putative membrane protein